MIVQRGTSDADGLRGELRARRGRAWVRAVIGCPIDGIAPLLDALVVVGPRPSGWQERTWTYGECSFASFGLSTGTLASFLDPEREDGLLVGPVRVIVELMNGNFNGARKPSLALYDDLVLAWPSVSYTVRLNNQVPVSPPSEYLIGKGEAPSFPTFGAAYNAFFRDNFAVSGTNNPALGQLSIRFIDGRARIGRVRISGKDRQTRRPVRRGSRC